MEPTTSSLRTMRSPKNSIWRALGSRLQSKRSNSDRFAGSCLTTSSLMRSDWIKCSGIDLFQLEQITHLQVW